jgi:hypothetical protein
MAQSEVLHFERYPSEVGEELVDVWLSTEAEHEPLLIAVGVPARAAYRGMKATAEAIRLLRELEPEQRRHRNNDVHVRRDVECDRFVWKPGELQLVEVASPGA